MIPSSAELRYFLEVSNTLNISRAAERLGLSQPSLSLAMQKLETSLGVPLLLRSKSGVELTRAGRKLVIQARGLLEQWEKIREESIKDEEKLVGRYRIGCHPSVAIYSLPALLPGILRENSGLEIQLVHDLSRKITEEVISYRVDFGIVVNPVAHPDLVIQEICRDEVSFWMGPQSTPLQDLTTGEGVLIYDPDLIQSQSLVRQLAKRGIRFGRTLTSSNLEVITALVASGAGVGILPAHVAGRIREMGLRPVGKQMPKFSDRVCLVYRADAQRSPASRRFARALVKNAG